MTTNDLQSGCLAPAPRNADGRCASVAETVARLEAALVHVCAFDYVEQPICESLYRGVLHTEALGFSPMGKGATPLACKASTLAETAEWLALRRRRELPGYMTGHQDGVPDALPIESLVRHVAGATPGLVDRIKATDLAQHWVDGTSLMRETSLKVPLEYVHAISGTNGVGAGNRHEEAIVHGALEIIERRAVVTCVRNRMTLPTIDPDTITDPVTQAQMTWLREQGVMLRIKDLSFEGALPCIGVFAMDPHVDPGFQARHLLKAAAAYDRNAALQSALTELVQVCRMGRAATEFGDPVCERLVVEDDGMDNLLPLFTLGFLPCREPGFLDDGELIPFDPGEQLPDCLDDIERIKALCEQLGMDLVVVDLTDPAVGFPVVQVVIPGYSDILPYHPRSSPVLLQGWSRDLPIGRARIGDRLEPCTLGRLFPGW